MYNGIGQYDHLRRRGKRSTRLAAHISATKGSEAMGSTAQVFGSGGDDLPSTPKPAANKSSAPKAAAKPAAKKQPSETDVFLASFRTKKAERKRIQDVLNSDAVKGKESMALILLAAEDGDGAQEIIALLNQLPADSERERLAKARKQRESAEVWDKVHAEVFGERIPHSSARDKKPRFQGAN